MCGAFPGSHGKPRKRSSPSLTAQVESLSYWIIEVFFSPLGNTLKNQRFWKIPLHFGGKVLSVFHKNSPRLFIRNSREISIWPETKVWESFSQVPFCLLETIQGRELRAIQGWVRLFFHNKAEPNILKPFWKYVLETFHWEFCHLSE